MDQIFTLEDLDTVLQGLNEKFQTINANQILSGTGKAKIGAEISATQKTEYGTLTGTCRFL